MHASFTVSDIEGSLWGTILFALYLFVPGYVTGWATDVLGFRKAGFSERILLAVCLSVCVSPILANLMARAFSTPTCAVAFLLFSLAFVVLAAAEWNRRPPIFPLPRYTVAGFCLAGAGACIVLLSLVDLQWGSRLYPTVAIYDHGVRTALISSAERSGAPPANPFFYPGRFIPSRYYYYWNVLSALPAVLGKVSARSILYASSIWSALALASLIPLYLKHFLGETKALHRKSLIAICLLSVTGLDLLPTAWIYLTHHFLFPDMEWWQSAQITSWADCLLWVPHHVASLVACLAGFLALWDALRSSTRRAWYSRAAIAVLALASAAGLSVYVTLAFACFLVVWTLRYLLKRQWKAFGLFVLVGLLTTVISLPYLHDLRASTATAAKGAGPPEQTGQKGQTASPLSFEARSGLAVPGLAGHRWTVPAELIETACLYVVELGFYIFAGWFVLRSQFKRRKQLREADRAAWCLLLVVGFLGTFVRSSVIQTNDFGFRSMMLVQFVLLLWGALVIDERLFQKPEERVLTPRMPRWSEAVLFATLAIGLMGSVYQLVLLRTYFLLSDAGRIRDAAYGEPAPPDIGSDSYWIRSGFQSLATLLPANSIVQYNPSAADMNTLLINNRYQMVDAFSPGCGTTFGGSPEECVTLESQLIRIFPSDGAAAATGPELDRLCGRLKINILVAHRSDSVWRRRNSWVWLRPPLVANNSMRAFRCGPS